MPWPPKKPCSTENMCIEPPLPRLMPAAHRLRGDPNPFRVREFRETFLLALDGERDAAALAALVEGFHAAAAGSS
jgi:hypothetical protein